MLDRYTHGKVGRISPEAPVPVLHVNKEQNLPGGAGNVALNLAAFGANVHLLGRIGPDNNGKELKALLEQEGIHTDLIACEEGFPTPVKNRLMGGTQQMLRIDHEYTHPFPNDDLDLSSLPDIDLIAISDYNKGFLTPNLLKQLIAYGKEKNIPVLVDPKGDDFTKYRGATLIKPNLNEAHIASKCSGSLEEVTQILFKQCQAKMLLITRSKDGMSLFTPTDSKHFPVRSKEVQDVTGAGDTVLAALSLALANDMTIEMAIDLANIAAGISIEKLGCARITLADIAERMLTLDATCKVFDEHTLYALTKALEGDDFTILGLDSGDELSTDAFKAIKVLKSKTNKLIIYIRDEHPDPDFIALLSALHEVDFVVIKSESLAHLCDELHPQSAYLFKSGALQTLEAAVSLLC